MNETKRRRLEARGWRVGTIEEFLEEFLDTPYIRSTSGKTPEQIKRLRRKFKRKLAFRDLRERIARCIFRF